MAPVTSAPHHRSSSQAPQPAPDRLQHAGDPPLEKAISQESIPHTTAVSPSPHAGVQTAQTHGPPSATLPISAPPYTQCSAAFPRLLRATSDPQIQSQDPASPLSSDLSQDYPPLPRPAGPPARAHQLPQGTPQGTQDSPWTITVTSPPPKAQRLSRSRDSSTSRHHPSSMPSYAQKAGALTLLPTGASPPHQRQAETWSDPWDSPATGTQSNREEGITYSNATPPGRPPPNQCYGTIGDPPLHPQWQAYLQAIPTKEDFRQLIEDVKSTCRTEIQVLQTGLKHLADRMEMAEEEIQETKLAVHRTQLQGADHREMLRDMQRHVEDLDNRGRRNNIRVRGIPEAEGPEDLQTILQSVFNNLIGEPPNKHIELDRAHRALRPKGATAKPRDIICRVSSYLIKEEIMKRARLARKVTFDDVQIQLYPDLSWITLQKRRLLQPLLQLLQKENITYRWGFPFSLTAKHQGKSAVMRYPEDLRTFCNILEIPAPKLPDWDIVATPPPPPTVWQKVPPSNRSRESDPQRKPTKQKNR